MSKETTIEIGGQQRTLKFGTMGFFKYIAEVITGDPIEFVNQITTPKNQYEIVFAYVYAGLRCSGDNTPKDQIDTWVQSMEFEVAKEILKVGQEAMLGGNGKAGEKEAGELVESASPGTN